MIRWFILAKRFTIFFYYPKIFCKKHWYLVLQYK